MNAYFARLNPSERRFVVGVGVVFFIVINLFWVWPHFSDWSSLKARLESARLKLANCDAVIQQGERLKPELAKMEGEGASVPFEDQSTEFMRTIQLQASQSGVAITTYGHQTARTNQFFTEQSQTISGVSTEKQLVDFMYSLGSGNSLVRVRSLSVHPDGSRQQLNANITLVASYQKNPKPQPAAAPAKASPARTAPVAPGPSGPKPVMPKKP
jgi:Tfp pilus assembly protein PilO